ncbi:MAG: hypothetical protein Q4D27_06165 [Coriobacteriia bacterium]|nr:hypothetical protein [Coriobacteriia bacterium]
MTKSRVIVEFPDRAEYAVRIGGGVASQLGANLRAAGVAASRCLVVCDAEASTRCLPVLKETLSAADFRVTDISVPPVDPADAWSCMGELLGALAQMNLAEDAPIIVCAGVELSELASLAFSLDGSERPLVLVPASLAAAMRVVGVGEFEADAGFEAPLHAKAAPSFASVDPVLLACESGEEADAGLYELEQAAGYCDAQFGAWLAGALGDIAAYDEDALVLALTQVFAARADAIGRQILHQ